MCFNKDESDTLRHLIAGYIPVLTEKASGDEIKDRDIIATYHLFLEAHKTHPKKWLFPEQIAYITDIYKDFIGYPISDLNIYLRNTVFTPVRTDLRKKDSLILSNLRGVGYRIGTDNAGLFDIAKNMVSMVSQQELAQEKIELGLSLIDSLELNDTERKLVDLVKQVIFSVNGTTAEYHVQLSDKDDVRSLLGAIGNQVKNDFDSGLMSSLQLHMDALTKEELEEFIKTTSDTETSDPDVRDPFDPWEL